VKPPGARVAARRRVPPPSSTRVVARALLRDALAGRDPVVGPRLVRVDPGAAGERAELRDGLVIGRAAHAAFRLDAEDVSRSHARVVAAGGGFAIVDLGSKNGVAVNGRRIGGRPRPLRDGDVVALGAVALRVEAGLAREPTRSAADSADGRPCPGDARDRAAEEAGARERGGVEPRLGARALRRSRPDARALTAAAALVAAALALVAA
jgi:hypothetical protein